MLVLGDFGGAPDAAAPRTLDKDDIAEFLKSCAEELSVEVPNRLADEPARLEVRLRVSALEDFTPAGLARQLPFLASGLRLRDRLKDLARGEITLAALEAEAAGTAGGGAFAEALRLCREAHAPGSGPGATPKRASAEPRAAPGGPRDDAIDRILGIVSGASDPEADARAERALERFVSEATAGNRRRRAPAGVARAIALSERVLGAQIDEILHHPLVQEREALWRGLTFLVRRADFRAGIAVEVLNAPRDRVLDVLREHVLVAEAEGVSDAPIALLVAAFEIVNRPADLDWLQALGEAGERLQAPVLVAAGPGFFGLDSGAAAGELPYVGGLLGQPQFAKWRALRDKEASRWLCIAFNRFLLRPPHGAERRRSLGLSESVDRHEDYLWGDPVWAVASLIAASVARCGWPTEMTGAVDGRIEGLDLYAADRGPGRPMQIPLAAAIPDRLAEDLAEAGITALTCRPERDSAYVMRAPTLHRPEVYGDTRATAASRAMARLPYQLLAARIAAKVARNRASLTAGKGPEEIGWALERFLWELVAGTGAGAAVEVGVARDAARAGRPVAEIRLRTGAAVLNGAEVALTFPV